MVVKVASNSLKGHSSSQLRLALLSLATTGVFLGQSPQSHSAGLSLVDFNSVSAFGSAGAGRGVNTDASVMSTNPAGMAFLGRQQLVAGGMGILAGGDVRGTYNTMVLDDPRGRTYHPDTDIQYYQTFGSTQNYKDCTGFDGDPSTCYEVNGKADDFLLPEFVPSLYYAQPVTDQLWVGVGVYASFGGETKYKIESPFRYQALNSQTRVVNIQPTVSWKFDDTLAVGAGLMISAGQLEMGRMLNPWAGAVTDASAMIDGEGVGVGMNLGVIWKPLPPLSLGLAYRSPVKIKFEGDLRAAGIPGLGVVMGRYAESTYDPNDPTTYPEPILDAQASAQWIIANRPGTMKEDARTTITFPEAVDLSLSYELDTHWTLLANATWTRWSRMERFKITASGSPAGQRASDIVSVSNGEPGSNVVAWVPQDWSDVWSMALGGQYRYNDKLLLRGGYALDKSPTSDATRTARIPDNDRQWLTVGAAYQFNRRYSLDVAYGYMWMKPFTVHDANHKVDGGRQGTNPATASFEDPGAVTAKYRNMHAHTLAAQLTVKF
ncbi:outer membrane protein transport protein [Parendozoicomonas sp. Alg238-R29]|uniref:OmpP1/FadL family transporter n=1 Tax=Parendozoicomonas sp. Alg238-R29 TaxID=2993446 RepID=UPI00248D9C6F|nr:outer membrane protein transport protein [Parendozoicomonas sp. Alg238-R29]